MVDSKLMRLTKTVAPGQMEDWNKEPTLPPWEGQDKKQNKTHVSVNSQTDNKTVAMSKRRRSTKRSKSGVDTHDTFNAKQSQEGDLHAKLNGYKAVAVNKVVPTGSVVRTACSKQREAIPRYQTPFS